MRKYTFQMTKDDVREFCLRAIWEQQRFHRMKWLWILVVLALECIIIPEVGVVVSVVLFLVLSAVFAAVTAWNYSMMKRQLCEKTRVMWVEGGMLKLDTEGELYSETPCGSFTVVRVTRRLLMLGRYQAPKRIGWYPIPLRVFEDVQERNRFVEAIRNPQAQTGEAAVSSGDPGAQAVGESGAASAEGFVARAVGESGAASAEGSVARAVGESGAASAEASGMQAAGELGEPSAEASGAWTAGEAGTSSAGASGASSAREPGQEYLRMSFLVGADEWVRMTADATEIIRAGTMGEQKKNHIVWVILAAVFILLPCLAVWRFPAFGRITHMVLFVGLVVFLMLLRNAKENPEKRIRAQLGKGIMQNDIYGEWDISVTEMGIRQSMSGKSNTVMPWESLFCMVETDSGLFFYQKDKRHFTAIPKKYIESREQIETLKGLCRERQLEVLAGKRMRYAPNWLFPALTVIVIVGYLAANVWLASRDSWSGTYPDYVPLGEQVSVLRSLGFTIPDEMAETLRGYMEENDIASYVERYPYTWLLMNLSASVYDEDWKDLGGGGIFWFDFEGWDISTDYIMVLEGMQRLSSGSILDDVGNIREDTGNVNWERGTGTITVSLEWNGQEYSWQMDMKHDWIDVEVLGIYNYLLDAEDVPERFYVTGDGGQGALVFYGTGEWAEAFENATGLDLETYKAKKARVF